MTPLAKRLEDPRDIRSLARALGEVCLAEMSEIERALSRDGVDRLVSDIEAAVTAIARGWWVASERLRSGYRELCEQPAVRPALELLEVYGPVAHLAVLRGVCAGPLARFFAETRDCVELRRGDPVPPLRRPTHRAIPGATPHRLTLTVGHLLHPTGFSLFGGAANRAVRVLLDFSRRDELDEATWLGDAREGRFPIVASVHPWSRADDLRIEEVTPEWFFGVGPTAWDGPRVLKQLSAVADAGIAVLPELSVPASDALFSALASASEGFPRLVVCGSAHGYVGAARDRDAVRVNEALVLLDGRPLLSHRKIHPFRARYLGPEYADVSRLEHLTGGEATLRIAAGTYTRLAVVICADLNDTEIQRLLEDAGANMLLVPALTPGDGAFSAAMSRLASSNQAVSVIVNGTPVVAPSDSGRPLTMVLAGVPRAAPHEQLREYLEGETGRRAVGRLDLNEPLGTALEWQPEVPA